MCDCSPPLICIESTDDESYCEGEVAYSCDIARLQTPFPIESGGAVAREGRDPRDPSYIYAILSYEPYEIVG